VGAEAYVVVVVFASDGLYLLFREFFVAFLLLHRPIIIVVLGCFKQFNFLVLIQWS
jgi:hypothetical protein